MPVSGSVIPHMTFMLLVDTAIKLFLQLEDVEDRIGIMLERDLMKYLPTWFLEDVNISELEEYATVLPLNILKWISVQHNG